MGVDWIKSADFRDAAGAIDWRAFRRARLENGEICEKCGESIVYPCGYRTICLECKDLALDGEVSHGSRVRCPRCGATWDPHDADCYHVFGDGEHEVCCIECDHDFTISTDVSYTFTSPARVRAPRTHIQAPKEDK